MKTFRQWQSNINLKQSTSNFCSVTILRPENLKTENGQDIIRKDLGETYCQEN